MRFFLVCVVYSPRASTTFPPLKSYSKRFGTGRRVNWSSENRRLILNCAATWLADPRSRVLPRTLVYVPNGAEPVNVPGAGDTESQTRKDFSEFSNDELEEISRLARRIVKRLASKPSRRWQPVARGHRVNLRRSLRLSLKTGGELIDLAYKRRRPKRTKLVVICDVSGSMDIYSRLLLQFVYGLQNSFAKVESFVFATSLSRITGELKNKTYQRALDRLSSNVHGWSGGTRIGASLASVQPSVAATHR